MAMGSTSVREDEECPSRGDGLAREVDSKVCGGRANNDAEAAVWWVCARPGSRRMMQPPKGDKGACSLIVSDLSPLYTPGVINSSLSFYHAIASASDHSMCTRLRYKGPDTKLTPGRGFFPLACIAFPRLKTRRQVQHGAVFLPS